MSGVAGALVPRLVRIALVTSLVLMAGPLLVLGALYASTPVYRFGPPTPFTGRSWYNPYDSLASRPGAWRRANFHAHSSAWSGLTNGRQAPSRVVQAYRARGYDVIGVSNYQSTPDPSVAGAFPVYEHGWNVAKAHHLVFAPERVTWLDFPLWQSRHQQQLVLDALARTSPLVAIAHPGLRGGYSPEALRDLTHYNLIEVLNRYAPPADREWDAALSSGHAVWILASDDSHDCARPDQVGVNATIIHAISSGTDEVLAALRAGRAVGVHQSAQWAAPMLESLAMRGDTMVLTLSGVVDSVEVVGQNGTARAHEMRRLNQVLQIFAVAAPHDGYLRVVAHHGTSLLYTNPVVRWNNVEFAHGAAEVDGTRTSAWRGGWALLYAVLLLPGIVSVRAQRRRSLTTGKPAPRPV